MWGRMALVPPCHPSPVLTCAKADACPAPPCPKLHSLPGIQNWLTAARTPQLALGTGVMRPPGQPGARGEGDAAKDTHIRGAGAPGAAACPAGRTHGCCKTPSRSQTPSGSPWPGKSPTALTYRRPPSTSSQPRGSPGALGSSTPWHGGPWHVPGLSAGGLGPLRSPGRAGGSGAALRSPASLASPRQLPADSRCFRVTSEMRRRGPGAAGRCREQIFPLWFWLKLEGLVRGKLSDAAPQGSATPGSWFFFCRRATESGMGKRLEPIGSESCSVLVAWRDWDRARGTDEIPPPHTAFGLQFCSKNPQIKETS